MTNTPKNPFSFTATLAPSSVPASTLTRHWKVSVALVHLFILFVEIEDVNELA